MRSPRNRSVLVVMFGAVAALWSVSSFAGPVALPYTENFQSPAPSADATTDYPEFTASLGGGTATVDAAGVLHLTPPNAPGDTDQVFTVTPSPAPTGEIVILAQVGASQSNGNYNVGLVVGQNNLSFHPGFGGPPAGAFRVEGPGGFGNSDMGFVPANGVLHQFEVHSFPNGDFTIKVTDGSNPANVYNAAFNNPGSYGGPIGFRRSGPASGDGQYDNLQISIVPEPSVIGALGLGLGCLLARRRRQPTA